MQVPEIEVIVTGADGSKLLRTVLIPGDYVIGREAGCDLHLDVDLVSRRHAQLTVNFDHALIEDLGSSNGTLVNGKQVTEPTRLWPNQKIQVGAATLELRRLKTDSSSDHSLAPQTAAVRKILPEEFLREKKYDIGGVVAQGGMGAILDAKDATIERKVAMKVMLDGSNPEDLARFVSEAKITGQLEHPSIVPVYDLSVDENDQVFYTMKFVRGNTLRKVLELMAEGNAETIRKFPLGALLTIFQKVCDALAFAHSKGVIHRDLKPENIMLGDFGEVLVMDWGLAKNLGESEPKSNAGIQAEASMVADGRTPTAGSTMAGAVMGTPQFMSPEQARGEVERVDSRSDIYSLGAILYQILSFRAPATGKNAWEVVDKVGRGEIEPITAPAKVLNRKTKVATPSHLPGGEIPESLAAVVRKAMSLERSDRYQSVPELQTDIEAYQNGFATSAEKAGAWKQFTLFVRRNKSASIGAAAVLLVGLGFGSTAVIQGHRATRALADLKKTAPALRQLAESEAGFQHFDSALDKLDAAIALDPADLSAYWRRSWLLLGKEDYAAAAAAIRTAQAKDSAHPEWAQILPVVEQLAAAEDGKRWTAERAQAIYAHLQKVGAAGEVTALSVKMHIGAQEKMKLIRARLDQWLGKDKGRVQISDDGLLNVDRLDHTIDTLEPLHGLPINGLSIERSAVADLEPLRGMPLTFLDISTTRIASLEPLRGMRLTHFLAHECKKITDWSPLRGMPLQNVGFSSAGLKDFSFLAGAPIKFINAANNPNLSDISALRGSPIEVLEIIRSPFGDMALLLSLPKLEKLKIARGRNLEPLRHHPTLKYIAYNEDPFRPVAEVFKEYDARMAEEKITAEVKLETRIASAKKAADGTLELDLEGLKLEDLRGLQGLKISTLKLTANPVSDLSPLRNMPLRALHIARTAVSDISPLRGMPLEKLEFPGTPVKDLRPLLEMPKLRNVLIPRAAENIEVLRSLKNLEYIGFEDDRMDPKHDQSRLTAAEFWKRYDALKAAGK